MSEKKKRKFIPSIKGIMLVYVTVFIVSLLIILAGAIVITFVAMNGAERANFYYEIIFLVSSFAIILGLLIFTNIRVYNLCYKKLFLTSKQIVEDITKNKQTFDRFPENKAKEYDELNNALDVAERHLQRSIVYSRSLDYSSLKLEPSNPKLNTIKYDSFVRNIPEIIMMSQAYKNAFLYITYGEKLDTLIGQTTTEIVRHINRIFDYENTILSDNSDDSGYILYIPQIDSVNRLKEEVEFFIKNASMVKDTPNGKALTMARVSVVMYPFSDIPDIISDLRYANRQAMNINFYIPDRINKSTNETVMHGSHSLNRSNQLITNLSAIRIDNVEKSNIKRDIRKMLNTFAAYINADYYGVIARDDRINKYYNYIAVNNKESIFQKEGEFINSDFLAAAEQIVDDDNTYFFSSRSHLNAILGSYLDKFSLTSGYLYLYKDDMGSAALIYFANYRREMNFDSYLRQATYIICNQVGSILHEYSQSGRLQAAIDRSDIIMKLSNYMLYGINKNTHEILFTSKNFEDFFEADLTQPCYKAIYNNDAPCKECPITMKQKVIKTHKNVSYESSLVLNDEKNDVTRILVKPVENDEEGNTNRFDHDFLINSYHSLVQDVENVYNIQSRGYILVLEIQNYKKILEAYGSEGYVMYVRKFTDYLTNKSNRELRFYLYDNSKLALIIPDSGRTEIIDVCEMIYNASKTQFIEIDDQEFIPLNLNYIAVKYPQEYATYKDLLRHTEVVITEYDHKHHIDEIYFEGNKYFRRASRSAFINEVIEKSFKEKTFKVQLQPMVNSTNRHIEGAEILIRLSDDYRNQQLRAFEVIKVAGQTNKIGIITEALLEYIGDLYLKQGSGLFKVHEFNRLSLNTDYSYFADESFLKNINKLFSRTPLPKNFLSFEINEKELGDHYLEFKTIVPKLKQLGIYVSVDQYTGRYVSLDKIHALDISEIKIPRPLIKDIDTNKASLKALQELIKIAEGFNIATSVVGVENKDQFSLIRENTKQALIQGFYFYEPLELPALIEAIRVN
ncbi:MAG: EAL domain-containing protein [Bacilli bacterium]|nr:EAL domain-containing protein [Bacilli bacterium]